MNRFQAHLLLLMLICRGGLSAQEFSVGIIGGLNRSSAKHSFVAKTYTQSGLYTGGLVHWRRESNLWGLQGEFAFIQRGATLVSDSVREKWRFEYLTIPMLIVVNMEVWKLNLMFETGPEASYLLSAKNAAKTDTFNGTINIKRFTSNFNFAWDFGFTADYGFADGWGVFLKYRFGLGLSDIDRAFGEVWRTRDKLVLVGLRRNLR